MILPRLSFLRAGMVLLLLTPMVQGQQKGTAVDSSPAADKAVREKAFALLESLAGQIGTLQSAENRARVGSNIAASVWDHDENIARSLLNGVQEEIRPVLQNVGQDEMSEIQTRMVFLHLRIDTVERIAKHDPELAFAFLKATQPSSDPTVRYPVTADERALEPEIEVAELV